MCGSQSMTIFLILLYTLVLSYVGLMVTVIVGMFRPVPQVRSRNRPPVSVIVPARNEQSQLAATLESLAAQHYPGSIELIVVNDRSSDGTEAIIRSFCTRDERFRLVNVSEPDRRLAPKVNAVNEGIKNSSGDIIVTTDADCLHPPGWIEELVAHVADGVVLVVGYVESTRLDHARNWRERFETADWFSLMLASRSMLRLGWKFGSSANNQAYRRDAFDAAGGFGAGGRAPSGDEDLLAQRLGRLPQGNVVFAESPAARVVTHPMASWMMLLQQRRRWVSRYHHLVHYQRQFMIGIATLGAQSVALATAIVLTPLLPAMAPWVFGLWGLKIGTELVGMYLGSAQLGRADLWPWTALAWSLLHPFFIATIVILSLLGSGEWRAGAGGYQRHFLRRQWRQLKRRLKDALLGT